MNDDIRQLFWWLWLAWGSLCCYGSKLKPTQVGQLNGRIIISKHAHLDLFFCFCLFFSVFVVKRRGGWVGAMLCSSTRAVGKVLLVSDIMTPVIKTCIHDLIHLGNHTANQQSIALDTSRNLQHLYAAAAARTDNFQVVNKHIPLYVKGLPLSGFNI